MLTREEQFLYRVQVNQSLCRNTLLSRKSSGGGKGSEKVYMYSRTSLLQTPLGLHEVSSLKRCPYFRGNFVHFYVAGTTSSFLIREVSLFQKSLIERFHCIHYYVQIAIMTIIINSYWCSGIFDSHGNYSIYGIIIITVKLHCLYVCMDLWPVLTCCRDHFCTNKRS